MHRRALLSTLGLTAVGLAGCVSSGPAGSGSGPPEETPIDATPTETTPTDRTPTPTETVSGPAPASDAFGDLACPSFDEHADRAVCYHEAAVDETALDETSLVLAAEPEVVDPAADDGANAVRFVCYNDSGATIQFNPYDWEIHRRDEGGEWRHVAPEIHPEPMTSVATGERFTWLLPTGPAAEATTATDDDDDVQPVGVELDAGTYAFSVTVSFVPADRETGDGEAATGTGNDTATRTGDATATESVDRDARTELVALFRLESDARPVDGGATGTEAN